MRIDTLNLEDARRQVRMLMKMVGIVDSLSATSAVYQVRGSGPALDKEIEEARAAFDFIRTIKAVRQRYNLDLLDSKTFVEQNFPEFSDRERQKRFDEQYLAGKN